MSQTLRTGSPSSPLIPVLLSGALASQDCLALLDSGSEGNFLDESLVRLLGIEVEELLTPIEVKAIDKHLVQRVRYRTKPLRLTLTGNHVEECVFFVFSCKDSPVLLGLPWLARHNPHIDWSSGKILGWSTFCLAHCLRSASQFRRVPGSPSGEEVDLCGIPESYHDLREVFSKTRATSLPPHRPYDCTINLLPGATPPRGRVYSLSEPERQAMESYISESLSSGIIRPSSSPAGAGSFFVGKKDGGLRPCVDFRGLNEITVKNKYPLPLISSAFELVQGSTIFTKLDLRSAYHLVRIREGDEWKTAFNTPTGHYEYLVMPFGLTNAPAVFQALVNDVLRDMIDKFVFVYLDDILIYSRNREEHVLHVRAVLTRLLHNRLFVKAEKCEFHTTQTSFLGFILSPGEISMDPGKVQAVTGWPVPKDRKQLQRFLGFANFYRRFIRNYSRVAAPLHRLTSSKQRFLWDAEASEAFDLLKKRFTSAPILTLPDPKRQLVVEVDASDTGVGAVLSQRSIVDNKLHPCAFFSRRLSSAERNYDIGNRELLAVKLALEEWRHWLEGAVHPFLVWTDHRNLEYVRTARRLNARQSRWSLFFARFDFTLAYRPGTKNVKPDALSRQFEETSPLPPSEETILPTTAVRALFWDLEKQVTEFKHVVPVPPGCPPRRLFVPSALRPQVLRWGHFSRLACHPGAFRTAALIGQRYWWPSLHVDVRRYVAACTVCARNKSPRQAPAGLLHPLPVPSRPWSHISLDFVSGLPSSGGKTVILTIVDRFSKMVHLVPLVKLPSARETAELVVQHVFRLHGLPEDVLSDRGPQFTAAFWSEFCKQLGASVSLSSGFHPQTNGQTERMNQEVESVLRCLCSHNPSCWVSQLPWVEYAHNSLPSFALGCSPFEAAYGFQPPLFPVQGEQVAVQSVGALLRRCRRTWSKVRALLLKGQLRAAKYANRKRSPAPEYAVGQKVWLSTRDLPVKVENRKLASRFVGPFAVQEVVNPVAVKLVLPGSLRVHPVFHVSRVRPVRECELMPPSDLPPPARVVDGGPAFTVERILRSRRRGRGLQYLIDWAGYGPEERSWVPGRFVLDRPLVARFHRDHPDQPS